ncbi:polysaccharide lyase [Fibrobacter sp.]|uniref:polysaccharide lyase n=1 Tax=Fibrobacter sp. TaxID=35828 RepID=UPI0025B7C86E|nr:alginate lyase [Fibrobacter sp.]
MKRYICTTLFAAAATFAQFAQGASDTVSFVDFENREVGVYGNAQAKEDFKRNSTDGSWWYAMDKNNGENSKIVHDGEEHGNVLQLKYPKGCVGPSDNDTPACAAQIIQPLVKTADTMWSAYDIFFEDGFEFQLGGKLPGLCGGKCYTGNALPETGDGWSARIMWRKDGNAVQLIYFMGQSSEYGDDFKWDLNGTITQKQFTTGTWHRIVNKVSMNTVSAPGNGDKNGRVQAWLDGEPVLDVDTLRLRDYDTVKVDKFYLSTFHGGSSAEWAPTHDCFIRFDNFTVSTDSIAIAVNAATDTTPAAPDTSGTTRIMPRAQNRSAATPVKIYRIDGTLVGREILPNETRTHRLENGKRVKVWR